MVNLDPLVLPYVYNYFNLTVCASVGGQIAVDLMVDPPQPTQPSYDLYTQVRCVIMQSFSFIRTLFKTNKQKKKTFFKHFQKYPSHFKLDFPQEVQSIRRAIRNNAQKTLEVLSGLPGISCQPVNGGIFAFPRLHLSQSVIKHAKVRQPNILQSLTTPNCTQPIICQ